MVSQDLDDVSGMLQESAGAVGRVQQLLRQLLGRSGGDRAEQDVSRGVSRIRRAGADVRGVRQQLSAAAAAAGRGRD